MAELKVVARLRCALPEKFGLPRQSGLVPGLRGTVVFEPAYRSPDALRGLEGFSHIWLIWGFSANEREGWSPTVRPPRLGGNTRLGVFATRSPFRPNPLGLSAVELEGMEALPELGTVLKVRGADLLDGTPIYDIKPYLPYADSLPGAAGGFAAEPPPAALTVRFAEGIEDSLGKESAQTLTALLAQDPRPAYHRGGREYGLRFGAWEVRFSVAGDVLTVLACAHTA